MLFYNYYRYYDCCCCYCDIVRRRRNTKWILWCLVIITSISYTSLFLHTIASHPSSSSIADDEDDDDEKQHLLRNGADGRIVVEGKDNNNNNNNGNELYCIYTSGKPVVVLWMRYWQRIVDGIRNIIRKKMVDVVAKH